MRVPLFRMNEKKAGANQSALFMNETILYEVINTNLSFFTSRKRKDKNGQMNYSGKAEKQSHCKLHLLLK